MNDSALVLDGADNDGFVRKLLGGTPLRLPFTVTLGYASGRGLILRVQPALGQPERSRRAELAARR